MQPIQLSAELELGHLAIDDEHRKLLRFANELSRAIGVGRPTHEIALRIGLLADSTQTHFRSEEGLMLASGYGQYDAHKANHDLLLERLHLARQKIEAGFIPPSELLDFFVRAWATHHIVKFDLEFAKYLNSIPVSKHEGSLIV